MKSSGISSWLQIVSNLGLIGGLVLVAVGLPGRLAGEIDRCLIPLHERVAHEIPVAYDVYPLPRVVRTADVVAVVVTPQLVRNRVDVHAHQRCGYPWRRCAARCRRR